LAQLATTPLAVYLNLKEATRRILAAIREDPNGLLIDPPPQSPQGDPAKMLSAQAQQMGAQAKMAGVQVQAVALQQKGETEAQKLDDEKGIQTVELAKEFVIHQHDADKEARQAARDQAMETAQHSLAERRHGLDVAGLGLDLAQQRHDSAMDVAGHALDVHQALKPEKPKG
jgi:hypothetical protein